MGEVELFLDSGAPTLYNRWARAYKGKSSMGAALRNRRDNHEYAKSKEFLSYRDFYVQYIKKHADFIDHYVNMDIINNAEATWRNQKWMEKQGLSPVPVWHFGTDEEWLQRYIDEGYDYIAMGGLIPNHVCTLVPALDRIWRSRLTDSEGSPRVKVHGFALTSHILITRYPWYSVDSSAWMKVCGYGAIYVPPRRDGKWDWSGKPVIYTISKHGRAKGAKIGRTGPAFYKAVLDLVTSHGFKLGKSRLKRVRRKGKIRMIERVSEEGIETSHVVRAIWNQYYVHKFMETLPEWPWSFTEPRRGLGI